MKYTIDLETRMYQPYRLQKDSSWRKLDKLLELEDNDLIIGDPKGLYKFDKEGVVVVDGETYNANASMVKYFDETNAFIAPRLHRTEKPRMFTKDEMIYTIASGDDTQITRLLIDINGYFKIVDADNYKHNFDPLMAVWHNAEFDNCSDLVQDKDYLEETWIDSIAGWYQHLKTGELNVQAEFDTYSIDEEEVLKAIDELYRG